MLHSSNGRNPALMAHNSFVTTIWFMNSGHRAELYFLQHCTFHILQQTSFGSSDLEQPMNDENMLFQSDKPWGYCSMKNCFLHLHCETLFFIHEETYQR